MLRDAAGDITAFAFPVGSGSGGEGDAGLGGEGRWHEQGAGPSGEQGKQAAEIAAAFDGRDLLDVAFDEDCQVGVEERGAAAGNLRTPSG